MKDTKLDNQETKETNYFTEVGDDSDIVKAKAILKARIQGVINKLGDTNLSYSYVDHELPIAVMQFLLVRQVMNTCHPRARQQCLSDIHEVAKFYAALSQLDRDAFRVGDYLLSDYTVPSDWHSFIAPSAILLRDTSKCSDLRVRREDSITVASPTELLFCIEHLNMQCGNTMNLVKFSDDFRSLKTFGSINGYIGRKGTIQRYEAESLGDFMLWSLDVEVFGLRIAVNFEEYIDSFLAKTYDIIPKGKK